MFGAAELPVLFAHGQHNRPDSIVLATTEYRRAYAGKLPHVLARLLDGHLVWSGSASPTSGSPRSCAKIANRTGTRIDPGAAPRHVAVMAWDPAEANDPGILARRAEIAYGARLVLYPAPNGDHSALGRLLSGLTDDRFPRAGDLPARAAPAPRPARARPSPVPVRWVPGPEPVAHFTGRAEELARLDRWAADPQVALVGVTAWGGAGKTALVTHWVRRRRAARRSGSGACSGGASTPTRPPSTGPMRCWNGRGRSSGSRWPARPAGGGDAGPAADGSAAAGTGWAGGGAGGSGRGRVWPTAGWHAAGGTGRRLPAGPWRAGVLTSRFPFADLETFDGGTARMLDVPPFTPAEGVGTAGRDGRRLAADNERQDLVPAVDGHALAVGVLAGLLAARPPASDLAALRAEAGRGDAHRAPGRQSTGVLRRPAGRAGPVSAGRGVAVRPARQPDAVIAVAAHKAFGGRLAGWTSAMVQAAVRDRLGGLASWHPDGTISVHPLVRDTFRPLVMAAAATAAENSLADLPTGRLATRADALRLVEAIELLLDAGQWKPADDMYQNRSGSGEVWKNLPAARLGQRADAAFVATPARRAACAAHLSPRLLSFHLADTGLFAMYAGDLATAREYLPMSVRQARDAGDMRNLSIDLRNLTECLEYLGQNGPGPGRRNRGAHVCRNRRRPGAN